MVFERQVFTVVVFDDAILNCMNSKELFTKYSLVILDTNPKAYLITRRNFIKVEGSRKGLEGFLSEVSKEIPFVAIYSRDDNSEMFEIGTYDIEDGHEEPLSLRYNRLRKN